MRSGLLQAAAPLVLVVLVLARPAVCHAGCGGASPTWTADSPSAADVQACLDRPLHCGDVVRIPAGTASWTTEVSLATPPTGCAPDEGVTVEGATTCDGTPGTQVTRCTDNTVITLSGSQNGFSMSGCSNTSFCTLTGMTFILGPSGLSHGAVEIGGAHGQVSFRVHHIHIEHVASSGNAVMLSLGGGYGLVDHYLADSPSGSATPINVFGDSGGGGYGDWADPTVFGSNQFIIIEDSRANEAELSTEGFFDGYAGCKITVRHTTIVGTELGGGHGTDSGGYRGCVAADFYDNMITYDGGNLQLVFNTRSGSYLFHDNVVGGTTGFHGIALQYYRYDGCQLGALDYCGNSAGGWGVPGAGLDWTPISTDTSSDLSRIVTLNAPDWQASHAYAAGATVGPVAHNNGHGAGSGGGYNFQATATCTSGASAPNPWNQTVGDTQNDGTCVWRNVGGGTDHSASPGVAAGFDAAHPDDTCTSGASCTRYFDTNGGAYPFRDQPGYAGQQMQAPNYQWNNSATGACTSACFHMGGGPVVQEGRDYFNDTPKPGYTPYTYPDPLQLGDSSAYDAGVADVDAGSTVADAGATRGDAGALDAGASEHDASAGDAGAQRDAAAATGDAASRDAASRDAATGDAATGAGDAIHGGCSCRVAAAPSDGPSSGMLGPLALAALVVTGRWRFVRPRTKGRPSVLGVK